MILLAILIIGAFLLWMFAITDGREFRLTLNGGFFRRGEVIRPYGGMDFIIIADPTERPIGVYIYPVYPFPSYGIRALWARFVIFCNYGML